LEQKFDMKPVQLAALLLRSIIELFFACMRSDGKTVDFEKLEKTQDFQNYKMRAQALEKVDLSSLSNEETVVFFVNIYNALVIHALFITGFPSSKLEWRYFSRSACYDISKFPFTLDFIKNGVLRANNSSPWTTEKSKKKYNVDDPRFVHLKLQKEMDPRIHFVLSFHNKCSPCLRLIEQPDQLDEYLTAATKEYLEQFVSVSYSKKQIVLSKIFKWYSRDFGNPKGMLNWLLQYLNGTQKKELSHLLEAKELTVYIRYKYDWTSSPLPFRQAFYKDEPEENKSKEVVN